MKRGSFSLSRVLLAVLCSVFLMASPLVGDECVPRTARVLYVDSDAWVTSLLVTSTTESTLSIANDCFPVTRTVATLGAILFEDLPTALCETQTIGVAEVEIESGCPTLLSDAVMRDAAGNYNFVSIPELSAPIAEGGEDARRFSAIRNAPPLSTFVALVVSPQGAYTRAAIRIYDDSNRLLTTEVVDINGWAFHEVTLPQLDVGAIEILNVGPSIGPAPATTLDAVAFTGYRAGGSPRVVMPETIQ